MGFGGGVEDRELAARLVRIGVPRARQRARMREFAAQHGDAGLLVEREIVGLDAGDREQFGDDALVDVGILAQVERRQMEAEGVDRADQPAQRAAAVERAAALFAQRARERREIGAQRGGIGIGLRPDRAGAGRRVPDHRLEGGGEPRIDAGERAPIGFVAARTAGIVRRLGECGQRFARGRMLGRDRQFGAEPVDRVEIGAEHRLGRARQHQSQLVRLDVGIAVAVAADPVAEAQEARHARAQRAIPARVERGQRRQQHVAQIGERGLDLVGDVEPLTAQRARLPEQRDLADDRLLDQVAVGRLVARRRRAAASARRCGCGGRSCSCAAPRSGAR